MKFTGSGRRLAVSSRASIIFLKNVFNAVELFLDLEGSWLCFEVLWEGLESLWGVEYDVFAVVDLLGMGVEAC